MTTRGAGCGGRDVCGLPDRLGGYPNGQGLPGANPDLASFRWGECVPLHLEMVLRCKQERNPGLRSRGKVNKNCGGGPGTVPWFLLIGGWSWGKTKDPCRNLG